MQVKNGLEWLMRRYVPPEIREGAPDTARQGRLVVYFALVIFVAALSYSMVYLVLGMWLTMFGAVLGIVGTMATLWRFRRAGDVTEAGQALAGTSLAALAFVILGTGGLDSAALAWCLLAPVIATMIAGRHVGLRWVIAPIASFAVMWACHEQPWMPAVETPDFFVHTYQFLVPTGLMLALFAIAWSYEVARDDALGRISAASDAAAAARDEAQEAHAAARTVLDNIAQGLLMVSPKGLIEGERSAVVTQWLGEPRRDEPIWSFLARHDPRVADWLEIGWEDLDSDWMPLELALEQLPSQLVVGEQHLQLEYRPLVSPEGLEHVLLVISDVTAQLAAERADEAQREMMAMFTRYLKDPKGVEDFLCESTRLVEELLRGQATSAQEKRWVHTLKGNSALFGLKGFAAWLHELEDVLEEERRGCAAQERAAIGARWQELRGRLSPMLQGQRADVVTVDRASLDDLVRRAEEIGPQGRELARTARRWGWDRLQNRLELLAERSKGLALRLDKPDVVIRVEADDIWQPPNSGWSAFWGAVVHVVRNALDHGLESPEERRQAGKPGGGLVTLRATQDAEVFTFEVQDDGRGIDWDAIASRAREMGLPSATRADLVDALMHDGLSTQNEVSDVSGRGVGVGAVCEACEALGGQIQIHSVPGSGTSFRFFFPVQVASFTAETPTVGDASFPH